MDQLHEELKEPVVAETRDLDTSDQDDKREGDRSPSEDEFLSCDSSSDRGEGDGQSRTTASTGSSSLAETELLIQDEAGRGISEKERMKDRKFSCGHRRSNSEQVDEDADVDTTMMLVDGRASPEMLPAPRPASPCRTPGINLFQSCYLWEDILILHSGGLCFQTTRNVTGFSTSFKRFCIQDFLPCPWQWFCLCAQLLL